MSSQGAQRARGLASPSTTKQGPIKATQPFGLVHGSPTKSLESNESSRAKSRRSPDIRASPDRSSPSSPSLKGKILDGSHNKAECLAAIHFTMTSAVPS